MVVKPLTLVIGVFLASAGTRIAFWAGAVSGTNSAVGRVALVFAVMILLAAMGVLLQGISRETAIPRRIALVCLAGAALISAVAALTLSMLIGRDPGAEYPWLSVFYFGVFVAALFAAPAAFMKAIRLEELVEPAPPFDPFDPEEPPDEMIEPEPGPTLALLLARKRSLNPAPRRGT